MVVHENSTAKTIRRDQAREGEEEEDRWDAVNGDPSPITGAMACVTLTIVLTNASCDALSTQNQKTARVGSLVSVPIQQSF